MMLWPMQLHVGVLIASTILILLSNIIPLYNYIDATYILKKKNINSFPNNIFPELTVLLPVKNEELLIESKLDEILKMDYPQSKIFILIVNSGSSDSTSLVVEKYFENIPFKSWQIENLSIPGKSIGVNHALDLINTDYFVMMDTDAILQKDTLKKLTRWFSDNNIGAVCGQLENSSELEFTSYRNVFNTLRVAESVKDSTPIFEGSICAFRKSSLKSQKINPDINADDTQLALIIRNNGFRSIMDPSIKFFEPINNKAKSSQIRKLRRAQGLSRVLWDNKKLLFFKDKSFRNIYRHQFFFYLLYPWISLILILFIFFSSFIEISSYNDDRWFYIYLLSLIPLSSKLIRELINGIAILIISHLMLFLRKKLNVWETDSQFRKIILDYRFEDN